MRNISKVLAIALIVFVTLISGCSKPPLNDLIGSRTAVKYTTVQDTMIGIYPYKYICFKYQNCWFEDPKTGAQTLLVNRYTVYSTQVKPLGQWFQYGDPHLWEYFNTKNLAIDSIPLSEEGWLYITEDSLYRI